MANHLRQGGTGREQGGVRLWVGGASGTDVLDDHRWSDAYENKPTSNGLDELLGAEECQAHLCSFVQPLFVKWDHDEELGRKD